MLSDYIAPAPGRHLPHMLLATSLVAVLPLGISLALRATGVVSGWVSVGLAVVMSLAASTAGSTYWRTRDGHGEVLFSELLLWGWLRSWRQERELANATRLLGLVNPGDANLDEPDALSVERHELLLRQLAGALEGQDIYLNGHSRRVARHATMIARGMGLPSEDVARIRAAAAVHDVGKLRTPKAILNKPGSLTDEEFTVIKRHPVDGADMVAALGDPELTRIVRHHHERLDGAGYPGGLCGEEIPLGARIIAVADTFDAITSARPYRDAAPHQKAIGILRKEAGTQLDPDAVRAFLAYYSGNRPALIWAIITSSVRRVVGWLTGDPAAAATISASKVAAATVATATIGAVAAAAPVPAVHHAPRPAAAHAVTAPRRGAATTLRRPGVAVTLPGTAGARKIPASKTVAAQPHRRDAHRTAARRHAKPAGAKQQAHRSSTGTRSPASATPSGQRRSGSTHASTPFQSAGTRSAAVAGAHASPPASSGHSQGSSANGNAYGHTKPLGNGHGKGVANGHGAVSASSPPASHGNGNGNNHGNGHGNSNGNGNAHPVPAPTPAVTPSAPSTPGNSGNVPSHSTGNGDGNGQGQDNGHASAATQTDPGNSQGHGNSQGNGDSQGHGSANGG